MPQHTAAVNPRIRPKELSTARLRSTNFDDSRLTSTRSDYFRLFHNGGRLFTFRLQTEDHHYFLQILPDFTLRVWISQQVSRMIGGNQFRAAKLKPLAAKTGDALGGLQKSLRRAASQAANYFRTDHINLAEKKGRASGDFIFFGQAIFRRAAFHHVANVNIFAAQAHGFDHLREQFPGAADERFAFDIFVVPGTFADENQFRFQVANAENNIGSGFVQCATRAIADGFSYEL